MAGRATGKCKTTATKMKFNKFLTKNTKCYACCGELLCETAGTPKSMLFENVRATDFFYF